MDRIRIVGGNRLNDAIPIPRAKNAARLKEKVKARGASIARLGDREGLPCLRISS